MAEISSLTELCSLIGIEIYQGWAWDVLFTLHLRDYGCKNLNSGPKRCKFETCVGLNLIQSKLIKVIKLSLKFLEVPTLFSFFRTYIKSHSHKSLTTNPVDGICGDGRDLSNPGTYTCKRFRRVFIYWSKNVLFSRHQGNKSEKSPKNV